jgi:hypothetical protein
MNTTWNPNNPPTVEEVPDDVQCWVTQKNGTVIGQFGGDTRFFWKAKSHKNPPIAWKSKETQPEPYQPPKPKRREWWINCYPTGRTDVVYLSCESAENHAEPDCVKTAHVREVLPMDPTPEEVEEVAEWMRIWSKDPLTEYTERHILKKGLEKMAAKLRGNE